MPIEVKVSYETRKAAVDTTEVVQLPTDRKSHEFGTSLNVLNRLLKDAEQEGALESQNQTSRTISITLKAL